MLRSVRRAGAVAGLLALAAVTAFGGAATAAPGKLKSPSQAMAAAAKGGSGGSDGQGRAAQARPAQGAGAQALNHYRDFICRPRPARRPAAL